MGTERTSAYLSCPGAPRRSGRPRRTRRAVPAHRTPGPAPVSQKHGYLTGNEHLIGNEKDHNDAGKAPAVGGKSFCSSWAAGNDHKTPLCKIHVPKRGGLS